MLTLESYFLIVMVVNLIPGVAPVQPVTSIIPLVFVIGVAMVKEAVEDWV
jgi:phospholipid-transporting ATPase